MRKKLSLIPLLAGGLAGCTLGPTYDGPPAPPLAAGQSRFVRAEAGMERPPPTASAWWLALNDPVLNGLVDRTLRANPDLGVALARLRGARAALGLERANGLPKAGASALYAHARLPGLGQASGAGDAAAADDGASSLNLYSLGVNASWELDLFGGQRRAVEAAVAGAEAAQASLADVQVSLAAGAVSAYINLRDRQRRIALGEQSVRTQQQALALTRARVARGTASELDLIRLDNQLEQTRADQLPLQAQAEACLNQLATLAGEAPGALDGALAPTGAALPLPPAEVAVGDPQRLIRHRPDLRAAERQLAADSAKIGQAEAARYPSLKFLGLLGVGGTHAADLTHLDDSSLILAPMLSWNFVDFGRARARVTQADAVRDESAARYRKAVLEALRDAEDSLSRFHHARGSVATLARTKAAADRALALTTQRYQAGAGTLIDVLDTTRQQLGAQQALSEGQANLLLAFVAVQKSLGLGWDDAAPPENPR